MQIAVTNPVRLLTQQDQPQRAATTEGHAAGQWAEVAGLGVKRAPGASHACAQRLVTRGMSASLSQLRPRLLRRGEGDGGFEFRRLPWE